MKLPKLPRRFFSFYGPLPVEPLAPAPGEDVSKLCGRFQFDQRRIEYASDMHLDAQWITLWHEAVHVATIDSGVTHGLSHKQKEMVCDAVAGYLTAMMKAGWLKVTIPPTGDARPMAE